MRSSADKMFENLLYIPINGFNTDMYLLDTNIHLLVYHNIIGSHQKKHLLRCSHGWHVELSGPAVNRVIY